MNRVLHSEEENFLPPEPKRTAVEIRPGQPPEAGRRTALVDITNNAVGQQQVAQGPAQAQAGPSLAATITVPTAQIVHHTSSISLHPFVFGEPVVAAPAVSRVVEEGASVVVEDIDAYDHQDPLFCTEYVEDIYAFLREKERAERVDPGYMRRQPDLNERMRAILVDWLVEVSLKFKLATETFFLTVHLVDKYLEKCTVDRRNLQLVGVTAMLIATKIEEIYPPGINDLVYIGGNGYSRRDVVDLEGVMLSTLEWRLLAPSPVHFLRRFSKAAKNDGRAHTLCKYLLEVAAVEPECLPLLPSQVAAGAVYLGRHMLSCRPLWTPTMKHYIGYNEQEVRGWARFVQRALVRPSVSSLRAVRKKYASAKLHSVSRISPGSDL